MDDETITLDRKTFKTLASDTRVNILKSLDQRRKTLSELSKQFKMSVSTISEHLGNLAEADLVVQKDEGHKWKYYELTRKGRGVLYPDTKKIWVLLSVSALAILALSLDSLKGKTLAAYQAIKPLGEEVMRSPLKGLVLDQGAALPEAAAAPITAPAAAGAAQAAQALPWLHMGGILIFTALLSISLFLLYRKRAPRLP